MNLPRFLTADNTDNPEDNYIIHTEYPRFIINLIDDEIEFLEDIKVANQEEFTIEIAELIQEASTFYDREIKRYSK